MSSADQYGRIDPPFAGTEFDTLLGFLDYQRATFEWKVRGLDAPALGVSVGVSTMTLGGLIKHLAYVEDDWFNNDLLGRDAVPPWNAVDWTADRDWEWHSAAADSPDALLALWRASVHRSRSAVAEVMDGAAHDSSGLDTVVPRALSGGRRPSLRWILVHMIEEYARHNGHSDLIRESIDGAVGE